MTAAELRQRLTRPPQLVTSPIDDLNVGMDQMRRELEPGKALIPAAVLIPFVLGPNPSVLLTKRNKHLTTHAGQVSFPGGRIDPTDATPEAAALREAEEEIGLRHHHVEILGRLADHITGTGYRITPIVGLLPTGMGIEDLALIASPHEVETIFELPLSVLLDRTAPQRKQRIWRGYSRGYWEWPHAEHHIWGATAAILVTLATLLRNEQ